MEVEIDGHFANDTYGLLPPDEMETEFKKVRQVVQEVLTEELSIDEYIKISVEETAHEFHVSAEDEDVPEVSPDEEN